MKSKIQISICMGSSCFSRGNNILIQDMMDYVSRNNLRDVVEMVGSRCEKQCLSGPNVSVNGKVYGCINSEKLFLIIDDILGN